MTETSVTVATADGPMDAFVVSPGEAAAKLPAMIVIQEAYGVNPNIQDICRRLAGEGYLAIAPEIFHRAGAGIVAGYDDFARIRPIFATLTNDGLTMDVQAALAAVRARPDVDPARVGIVGFCVGGLVAFLAACRTDVATAICFYAGGLVHARPGLALTPPLEEAGKIRNPVLFFFGGADAGIPEADVQAVRSRLTAADKKHEIHVMPGAGHGFFCADRSAYHAGAAAEAWTRTVSWLEETL